MRYLILRLNIKLDPYPVSFYNQGLGEGNDLLAHWNYDFSILSSSLGILLSLGNVFFSAISCCSGDKHYELLIHLSEGLPANA
jgi:hypothetical protein